MKKIVNRLRWYKDDPTRIKRAFKRRMPGVLSAAGRSTASKVRFKGMEVFKKTFADNPEAMESCKREMMARSVFDDAPWIVPIIDHGPGWISCPYLPSNSRLDKAVLNMDRKTRVEVAGRALFALLEMHSKGLFHGDFHAGNLFWHQNELLLIDFEKLGEFEKESRPLFEDSFDINGNKQAANFNPYLRGLPTFYTAKIPSQKGMEQMLGIPVVEAMAALKSILRRKLMEVCGEFQSRDYRHTLRSQKIYSSFDLPRFKIASDEAQRDSRKRIEKYQITKEDLQGKKLLDLGCNIGGMIFEAQKYHPHSTLGIEFDVEKVRVANMIASLNGLNNVLFRQADVDHLTAEHLEQRPDVVFCFALNSHVQDQDRLYKLLGNITRGKLFFEGNADADIDEVKISLRTNGFNKVKFLGTCDDDCLAENNKRPLFVAKKLPEPEQVA